jgi:NADPH:quinone reductase-like Zn-dependent oxidoreductase
MSITTDAWVLYRGEGKNPGIGELKRETYTFDDINEEEVLARPVFGCWEGNMGHAIDRKPVDICKQRDEERVVIGNSGVVEILKVGSKVDTVSVGDKAILFCNGESDRFGYPITIHGYDSPGSIGMLAKEVKLHQYQVIPIPQNNVYDLSRWAAFSLRYVTAWSNWRLAYNVLRLQLDERELPAPVVWGWGGGVALAELHLAHLHGCKTVQVSSRKDRRDAASNLGIGVIDRNEFPDLRYDNSQFKSDEEYRKKYIESESRFIEIVQELTYGKGVNIFIDYVGSPVIRATIKAMARQGVLTTAGWKAGMFLWFLRASECIDRHQHVHTHYARYSEGIQAVRFAIANGWLPVVDKRIYSFDEINELSDNYNQGQFTYYPCYSINT